MNKIVPHLWFDTQAVEAAGFYSTVFPKSKITHKYVLTDTPSGDCDVVSFEVCGMPFMSISAGPVFKFNPAVSFMVNFDPKHDKDAVKNIDNVWERLVDGGKVLMELQEYPFSKRYGWLEDKYGVSWQLILTDPAGEDRPPIIPSLLFVKGAYGRAGEAINYYASVFKGSKKGAVVHYGQDQKAEKEDAVMFGEVKLLDTWFALMDSGSADHTFQFNEAISFMVRCDTQEEIDYYWEKLSAVPEAEQCGWCKDKFGVSWQIVPSIMEDMMRSNDKAAVKRLTECFLKMKKFDIKELQKAY